MEFSREQLAWIQQVGEYRSGVRSVRGLGVGAVIFGVLAVVAGVRGIEASLLNAVLVAIGVLLVGAGVWQLVRPSLKGLIVNGIVLLAVAAWNIGVSVLDLVFGGVSPNSGWIVLGVMQVAWGIQSFTKYNALVGKFGGPPPREALAAVDELVASVKKQKPKQSENVIEFDSTPFLGSRMRWRGLLLPDAAVFVSQRQDVMCAVKDEVSFVLGRKRALAKQHKVEVRVGTQVHKGTITRQSAERLASWKASAREAVPVAPTAYASDDSAGAEAYANGDESGTPSGPQPPVQW